MSYMRIRSAAALLLALLMLLTTPLAALADTAERSVQNLSGEVAVWDETKDAFVRDDALTAIPILDADLAPTVPAVDPEGYIYPALQLEAKTGDASFTMNGDVAMVYEDAGAYEITAVLVESLPDLENDEEAAEDGYTASATLNGDVTAKSASPYDGDAISAYGVKTRAIGEDNTVEVAMTGDVSVKAVSTDEENDPEYVFGRAVEGFAGQDGEVTITIDGDASGYSSSKGGPAGMHGTGAYADDGGVVTIHVTGDSTAESHGVYSAEEPQEEKNSPDAEDMAENRSSSNTIAVFGWSEAGGRVSITVDGKAAASSEEIRTSASAVEADAVGSGALTEIKVGGGAEGVVSATAVSEGHANVTISGGVISESGADPAVSAIAKSGGVSEMDITGDAAADVKEAGSAQDAVTAMAVDVRSDTATSEARITGDVTATAVNTGKGYTDAVAVNGEANSQTDDSSLVMIELDGNATAVASAGDGIANATAVNASAFGEGSTTVIHVAGDAVASAELSETDVMQFGIRGVFASAMNGSSVIVDVDGSASASTNEEYAIARAVGTEAFGEGSTIAVTVGKGAEGEVLASAGTGSEVSITVEDGGVSGLCVGVTGETYNGTVALDITGDVSVTDTEGEYKEGYAYGMRLSGDGDGSGNGKITASVIGNITAAVTHATDDSYAVGLVASDQDGSMKVEVTGDITATGAENNIGIALSSAEGMDADVIVDGTVSGDTAAVVLVSPETQLGENVTLTVWALVPNEDGAVITRANGEEDAANDPLLTAGAEGTAERDVLTEDEAAEKAVQYIIRVRAGQSNIISTDGTTEYEGYDVAHEGDVVTLRLNIPAGYEITNAFGDVDQAVSLLKDENGQYYLTVPRGGAVELSVTMNRIYTAPAAAGLDESASETENGEELLTVIDTVGDTRLTFFKDHTYQASFSDGYTENGTFCTENGDIILVSGTGREMIIATVFIPENMIADGVLTYVSELDDQEFEFLFTREELDTLEASFT